MTSAETSLVRMVNIQKWFGKVHALKGVDFEVGPAEVVGLVGDNGAGKSTLIKILSGYHACDRGEIYFEGRKVDIASPRQARRLGIETVYQEQALVAYMSIARNIFMGREPVGALGFLKQQTMRAESVEALGRIELHLRSPDELIEMLSGGERQGVALARALHFKAKLVILDEPTIALSIKESREVLEFILQLKRQGVAAVFITHNLYHAYPVAERFVVLNRGRKVADVRRAEVSIEKLSELIVSPPPEETEGPMK
jgi:simple sugar transport system ATP-binding protein